MVADTAVTHRIVVNLLLVALGYGIMRLGLVSRDEGRVLNRIVLYVTLPAMNLKAISQTELSWNVLVAVFTLFVLPLSGSVRAMAFLLSLMPTSLSTLLYSVEQNLNPRLAAMPVSLTMVVSLVITTVTVLGFRHAF